MDLLLYVFRVLFLSRRGCEIIMVDCCHVFHRTILIVLSGKL